MLVRTFFSFNYLKDIKALPGFVRGGRDKVPKEYSDYNNQLIADWADQEIREHIENVATRSKNILEISAREFRSPVYGTGSGAFDCRFFNYDFTVTPSEEDFARVYFTGVLEVRDLESFNEIQNVIDSCFEYSFEKVACILPKAKRDIKELIYSLDDNKKLLGAAFDFSYENDFSSFQLFHKKEGRVITVNNNELEIQFKASESILQMVQALKEVNTTIYSATAQDYNLLVDGEQGQEPVEL